MNRLKCLLLLQATSISLLFHATSLTVASPTSMHLNTLNTPNTNLTSGLVSGQELTASGFEGGTCSFHAKVVQECRGNLWKDWHAAYVTIKTINDGKGNSISGLTGDVGKDVMCYDGFQAREILLKINGINGKTMEFEWYEWYVKEGRHMVEKNKMTYMYNGCYWDEDNTQCDAYCNRGDWTASSCNVKGWQRVSCLYYYRPLWRAGACAKTTLSDTRYGLLLQVLTG